MWSFILYGTLLGLSAGLSPGPLSTLVITQTLQYGPREGVRIAIAPLLTDVPIICLGLFLFSRLETADFVLGIISFAGSIFVAYLGMASIRQQPVELDLVQKPPRSYFKGVLTNALSPHPYLFWFTVGIPTTFKASNQSSLFAMGFVLSFYVCIVGAKILIAMLVGQSRDFLTGAKYLWVMRLLGVLLLGFSCVLFYDGLSLTGLIP